MGQTRGRKRLPCRALAILLRRQGDALERDGAIELLVVGVPYDSEPTGTKALHEPVAIEQELTAALPTLVGDVDVCVPGTGWVQLATHGRAIAARVCSPSGVIAVGSAA